MHVVSMDVEVTAVIKKNRKNIQVEQPRDLARDSGQRKLTHSFYRITAHPRGAFISVGD